MSTVKTDKEVEAIIKAAEAEALRFTKAYLEQHGDSQYPCGFAWVNIKPARGQFVKVMKAMGLGRVDSYEGGWTVWNPSGHGTQCMDAKAAGARAFAVELRKHGVVCEVGSRMD